MPLLDATRNTGRSSLMKGNQQSEKTGAKDGGLGVVDSTYARGDIPDLMADRPIPGAGLGALLSTCANPTCRSGWLHLWRSRSAPIFEGGWSCSPNCTTARVEAAVKRELEGRQRHTGARGYRVPLGLVMLEQGWITPEQLKLALKMQKDAGQGRLGTWLIQGLGVSENLVTRALGLQASCPVLGLELHDPQMVASILPRLFVDAFGALPVRIAASQILYLGFEDRIDPVLALGIERMLGLRVECGMVAGSAFRGAHERLLQMAFPMNQLVETSSEQTLVRVLSKALERAKPAESRLVRIHDCLWLRMWARGSGGQLPGVTAMEDVICSLGQA